LLKKRAILFALLVISLAASVALVKGQISDSNLIAVLYEDSQSGLIALSNNNLTFSGDMNTNLLQRTIIVVGLEDDVQVNFFSGKLYDATSQNEISVQSVEPFSVSKNDPRTVNIAVDTSGATAETYYGSIIVTATTTENSTTTNIDVTVTITGEEPPLTNLYLIMGIVLVMVFSAIGLATKDKFLWLSISLICAALIIWFSSVIATVFKDPVLTAIGTAIIAPAAGYAIDAAKKRRDERVDKIKSATQILTGSIKDDIEWLRSVIGETTTHYASFNPKFEGVKKIPTTPKILYQKSELLSREYWDKNPKQGAVSDLPMLHLEKYYDYIDLYNRYYEAAIMLTKGKTNEEFEELQQGEFLTSFETFREKYAELETVLFVYMSYLIGLFGQTRLSPLKTEYPRITRVLLYRLLNYGILKPKNYVLKKKHFHRKPDFSNEKSKNYYEAQLKCRLSFDEKKSDTLNKKKEELKAKYLDDNDKDREEWAFKKWYEKEFEKFEECTPPSDYERNQLGNLSEEKKNWAIRRLFKKKIKDWELSADDSEKILKDIYQRDDIPVFYKEAGKDYRYSLLELLESIKELEPLPAEFVVKEKTPEILKEHQIHKELLDDLTRLKGLKDAEVIIPKQLESATKVTLEHLSLLSKHSRKRVLIEELERLEVLRKLNVITQDEYETQRTTIKDEIRKIGIP
jgi:multisubunit Na+/H+ antiporter MnhG subunit